MADPSRADDQASTNRSIFIGLMLLTYTFNFIDRTIVGVIGQAIKVDLDLTDLQLGLLGGLSFAIFYTILGIPIARLAERKNRVTIITVSLVIWSGFTAACGLAQNFLQLVAMRIGVGVGEAGCSPPAHSLISDYYEPKQRASALSIYSFGIPLGTMIGAVCGGWLTDAFSWRLALVVVGVPGLILALLVKLVVKEPVRGRLDATLPPPPRPFSLRAEFDELKQVAASLFGRWPTLNMVLGITLTSVATYGTSSFSAPYFIRAFGLSYTEVGWITGLVGGLSAGVGTLAGGFVADRAARRHVSWYALVPAIGLSIAGPLYMWAYLQPSWQAAAAILLLPGVFAYTCLGPTYGVVQNAVQPHQRATATALLFFFLNFIALGFGPLMTGALIDHFAQLDFGAANFAQLCPGGAAATTASAELEGRCSASLVTGTRWGIVATFAFHLWASAHYFLAGRSLGRTVIA